MGEVHEIDIDAGVRVAAGRAAEPSRHVFDVHDEHLALAAHLHAGLLESGARCGCVALDQDVHDPFAAALEAAAPEEVDAGVSGGLPQVGNRPWNVAQNHG